jgi:hypothetical protein
MLEMLKVLARRSERVWLVLSARTRRCWSGARVTGGSTRTCAKRGIELSVRVARF